VAGHTPLTQRIRFPSQLTFYPSVARISASPVPETIAIEDEVEWVDGPTPGDCVVLRMDPVASVAHLGSAQATHAAGKLAAMHYLAVVGQQGPLSWLCTVCADRREDVQVARPPTEKKPWSNCIVYVLSRPLSREGVIEDFQPREYATVRIRARRTKRRRMVDVADDLQEAVRDAAAVILRNEDLSVRTYAESARLSEGCRWVYPKELQDLILATETKATHGATVVDPELDSYPVVDFSYGWKGFFGSPKSFFHEWDCVTT
jgi:hypothetical protein